MFDHTSRYYGLPLATAADAAGRTVAYVRRRFLPNGADLPLMAEVPVVQGDRIDVVAYRTLGDPGAFWRVCDANNAMDPQELTAEPGRLLRVPVPNS